MSGKFFGRAGGLAVGLGLLCAAAPGCGKPRDLRVFTDPPGASVFVDQAYQGRAGEGGLSIEGLEPGVHVLKAAMDGRETRLVTFEAGTREEIRISLPRIEPAALVLSSDPPGAEIFLDGQSKGRTPLRLDGLDARRFRVRVEASGYKPAEEEIAFSPGAVVRREFTLETAISGWLAEAIAKDPKNPSHYVDLIGQLALEGRPDDLLQAAREMARVIPNFEPNDPAVQEALVKLNRIVPVPAWVVTSGIRGGAIGDPPPARLALLRALILADVEVRIAVEDRRVGMAEAHILRVKEEIRRLSEGEEAYFKELVREAEESLPGWEGPGLKAYRQRHPRFPLEVYVFVAGRDPDLFKEVLAWKPDAADDPASRLDWQQQEMSRRDEIKRTDPDFYLVSWAPGDAVGEIPQALLRLRRAGTDAERAGIQKEIRSWCELSRAGKLKDNALHLEALGSRIARRRWRLDAWKKNKELLVEGRLAHLLMGEPFLPWPENAQLDPEALFPTPGKK